MSETKPTRTLRLLIIDDSADDAERTLARLRAHGYMPAAERAGSAHAADLALRRQRWDLILCESSLPDLSPLQAIALAHIHAREAVFIVLARRIADGDMAVIMTAGAADVVHKAHSGRLAAVIDRELRVAAERRAAARASTVLAELEQRNRAMLERSLEPIGYCHDGIHREANPAYLALFGYAEPDELKSVPFLNLFAAADRARLKRYLRAPDAYGESREFTAARRDGRTLTLELAVSRLDIGGEACTQIVAKDVSWRESLERRIRELHERDPLTGLYNRHYFLQEMAKVIDAIRTGAHSALIGVELHHLRKINDSLGRAVGDRLLLSLARILRAHTHQAHALARVGGGQFALLLREQSHGDAAAWCARLQARLKTFDIGGNGDSTEHRVTVARMPIDGTITDREELLSAAYDHEGDYGRPASAAIARIHSGSGVPSRCAQAAARATVSTAASSHVAPNQGDAGPSRSADDPASASAIHALEIALANDRVELLFQPIVSVLGEPRPLYAARTHVRGPREDWQPAAPLLALAARDTLAGKIDRWAVKRAIEVLAKLTRQGRPAGVMLQLSAAILRDPLLLSAMTQRMSDLRLSPRSLIIELDATLLRSDLGAMATFARRAAAAGMTLALDNFSYDLAGTLGQVAVDWVSVDCAAGGARGLAVHDAIIAAKSARKTTLAAQVADHDTFSALWSCGVDYIQGDYLQPQQTEPDYDFGTEEQAVGDEAPTCWRMPADA